MNRSGKQQEHQHFLFVKSLRYKKYPLSFAVFCFARQGRAGSTDGAGLKENRGKWKENSAQPAGGERPICALRF
ncbi:MAG: hypothetical protein E7022_11475 [Desulfovibrio desulfuricans]|jgi:hypothetical protein|nr:hypothetical protein [Desulfovibrio desulfuricans]